MLVAIDTDDPRPVFRQIVDEIQRCVAVGVLRAGDPLAAVRTLAADLQVNANTVQHAYRTLEQEGTVEVQARARDVHRQRAAEGPARAAAGGGPTDCRADAA